MNSILAARGMRPPAELAKDKPHGTRIKYLGGCRCLPCRCAFSNYETARARARKNGDWNGNVSTDAAREHILALSADGIGYKTVAKLSGVSKTIIFQIRSGSKRLIWARTERKILAVTGAGDHAGAALVDAEETWRLIDELIEEGFTKARISRELGHKTRALQIGKTQCLARTARAVRALWRKYMI